LFLLTFAAFLDTLCIQIISRFPFITNIEGWFMYAVVEIAGQQYKVAKADKIMVPKLEMEIGTKLTFEKVLLLGDEKQTKIGTPYLAGSQVEAKVLGHVKDEKVTVFKKKKRKGYRVRRGHRQHYTEIEVMKVV